MPIGLFLSLFIVITNDSVGVYKHTKIETTCEKHKLYLKRAISIGFVDFEEQFNEIIASTETEDEARKLIEEDFEIQHAGLKDIRILFNYGRKRYTKKVNNHYKRGCNPFYRPELVLLIMNKLC